MWNQVRTLRFKLTMLFLTVFGVSITVLSVVVLTFWESNVIATVDGRLEDRLEVALGQIERDANEGRESPFAEAVEAPFKSLRGSRYYIQLRSATGESRNRSQNLRNVRLPMPADLSNLRKSKRPKFETIEGTDIAALLGSDGQMRLLTRYCEVSGVLPFYIQIGLNLGAFDTSRSNLQRIFLIVIPFGMLAAGLASWFIARRSLAPIRKIAREAQELTAARLDRRMQLPQARDEVGELVITINQMLDRLEAAFIAQERFVADAAHELKTPVAVLLGELQVFRQKPRSPEEYDRYMTGLLDEMRRLAQMIDSLLTLARADAGLPLASTEAVSINETATDVVQRWQRIAEEKGIRLVLSLAMPSGDEPDPLVKGDADLLESLLGNLVQNGVRYSPAGESVEVKVSIEGQIVRVSVRDRGAGIPQQHMDRVFERFYRIPRVEEGVNGTGLGLAIAKGVTRLHGGNISVSSREGGGCEFVVELPLAPE